MKQDITTRKALEDIAVSLIVIFIAIAVICLAARVFCWSFLIPFHARYLVGIVTTALTLKWMFFNRRR